VTDTPTTPTKRAARGTVQKVVVDYMTQRQGQWFAPRQVAADTGLTSHQAAQTMLALAESGRLLRKRQGRSNSLYTYLPVPDEGGEL
jgi:hypothetical protein